VLALLRRFSGLIFGDNAGEVAVGVSEGDKDSVAKVGVREVRG